MQRVVALIKKTNTQLHCSSFSMSQYFSWTCLGLGRRGMLLLRQRLQVRLDGRSNVCGRVVVDGEHTDGVVASLHSRSLSRQVRVAVDGGVQSRSDTARTIHKMDQ